MNTYQCVVCEKKIEIMPEQYVAPKVLARERTPEHCGKPMMEIAE